MNSPRKQMFQKQEEEPLERKRDADVIDDESEGDLLSGSGSEPGGVRERELPVDCQCGPRSESEHEIWFECQSELRSESDREV